MNSNMINASKSRKHYLYLLRRYGHKVAIQAYPQYKF